MAGKYLILEDWVEARCLHRQFGAEEVEGALLQWGGRREQGGHVLTAEADGVAGQAGKMSQQRAEAGCRLAGGGQLGCRLASGSGRRFGRGDWGAALRLGGGAVVVVKQQRARSRRMCHSR